MEWLISRICEEFQCLPSQAVREWDADAAGLVLDLMELRGYARAKYAWDQATVSGDEKAVSRLLQDDAVKRVAEMEHALVQQERKARDST